ncbi:xanthine-guanine phosphoribosyltransferase [Cutibacterium acnes JCM 18918]|nr:xanthine-guanine phosphoribosyltransferase [Cutibacterium acnes JCM 18918]
MLDTESIRNKRILIVDDVVDSGRTLALVLELLRGFEATSARRCSMPSPRPSSTRTSCGKPRTSGSCFPGARNLRSVNVERETSRCSTLTSTARIRLRRPPRGRTLLPDQAFPATCPPAARPTDRGCHLGGRLSCHVGSMTG